jgi:spermidine synthase
VKLVELLGQTISPDGSVIKLVRRDDEYLILSNGAVLMSSRTHGSEEQLATLACQRMRTLKRPSVLIGGLGMGFTLRAALDVLPADATVVVAELLPAVVEWNRDPLGPLAGRPLSDKRVRVKNEDVRYILRAGVGQFDGVLLDVDNGPAAFTVSNNATLYDDSGIEATRAALKPGGVLAVWAARDDLKFEQRLRRSKFAVQTHRVRGRLKSAGARHTIFLAHKS